MSDNVDLIHGLIDPQDEVGLLLDVIKLLPAGPEIEPLAAEVAGIITEATATDVCFVHVLDDSERSLTLAGATPPFDAQVGQVRIPLGEGVSGWVAERRTPVVLPECKDDDPRYLYIPSLRGRDFTSMASIPMEVEPGHLVGVLNVHTVQRRDFTAHDVELLRGIGRLVAGALEQARLHRRLAAREKMHEQFAERVIATQEAERQRMAADIHDGISQRLVTLSYHLDAASYAVESEPAEAAAQLAHAKRLIGLALDEARAAIGGLRPPILEDLGLAGGLASLARSVAPVVVHTELAEHRLPEHVEVALYRIAQESLQNVVKHAHAARAVLRYEVNDGVAHLEVVDDGRGFDSAAAAASDPHLAFGFGLRSLAERAELVGGRLVIRSRPGEGTSVSVTVPMRSGPLHE